MEEMIREAFLPGNSVEILLRNYKVPTVGRFIGCSDGCLMLRTSRGNAIIVNISDIVRIANRPSYSTDGATEEVWCDAAPETENADMATATETEQNDLTDESNEESDEKSFDEGSSDQPKIGDFVNPDLFKLPTEKPELKVVGRIDLSSIRDPRKKQSTAPDFRYPQRRQGQRYRQQANTYPSYFYSEMIKPKGKIMRKGPAFGFIQNSEGKQVYMNCNEIVARRGSSIPMQGDDVVYSSGSNQQGEIAKCVHIPMSIGEQLELIEEIMGRDRRNARLLASQLQKEFSNDENVIAALQSLGMASFNQMPSRPRLDAQQVLDLINRGERVDGRLVLRAERELSENAVYDDYKHYAGNLLSYAMDEDHAICYQLLSRMIKMARANENEDDAQDVIEQAISLYKDNNDNIYQYFLSLRDARSYPADPAESEEEETSDDEDENAPEEEEVNVDAVEEENAAEADSDNTGEEE